MPRIDDHLQALAYRRCIPLSAALEITLRCNLRCTHCYNFDRAEAYPPERRGAELTREEVLDAIDQLRDLGCLYLSFTGGEATAHPHLFDFIAQARERRMTVSLLTNGVTLASPEPGRGASPEPFDSPRFAGLAQGKPGRGAGPAVETVRGTPAGPPSGGQQSDLRRGGPPGPPGETDIRGTPAGPPSTLATAGRSVCANTLAQRLADAGVSGVSISLYGATAPVHDAVTAVPGSFDRTLAGAAAARDAGMEVVLKFILFRSNAHEAEGMAALAARLGLPHQLNTETTGRYDGGRGPLGMRLTRSELEALYRAPFFRDAVLAETAPVSDKFIQCNCARSRVGISAVGDVYPCISAPLPAGNLREQPLAGIWRDSPVLNWIRGLRQEDFKACTPCPHRDWCRRSSGTVYVNTGDYTGIDPWTCGEAEVLHRLHEEAGAAV